VAELVDALGSGSSEGSLVGVRVSPSAPFVWKGRNPNGLRLFFLEWLRGIEAIYSTSIAAGDKMAVDVHGKRCSGVRKPGDPVTDEQGIGWWSYQAG
jgi:hypothetical protein